MHVPNRSRSRRQGGSKDNRGDARNRLWDIDNGLPEVEIRLRECVAREGSGIWVIDIIYLIAMVV
jgi:hypothetical protein